MVGQPKSGIHPSTEVLRRDGHSIPSIAGEKTFPFWRLYFRFGIIIFGYRRRANLKINQMGSTECNKIKVISRTIIVKNNLPSVVLHNEMCCTCKQPLKGEINQSDNEFQCPHCNTFFEIEAEWDSYKLKKMLLKKKQITE